jgi:hypothetical protein
MASLVDTSRKPSTPLPPGHPFNNVAGGFFWTDTSGPGVDQVWRIDLSGPSSTIEPYSFQGTGRVWCVRGAGGEHFNQDF